MTGDSPNSPPRSRRGWEDEAPLRALRAAYRLRWKRRRLLLRALRKRRQLRSVVNRTGTIQKDDVLAFVTLRNEAERLPYFLTHYRKLGVAHFIVVDNGSDDGSRAFLAEQPDVSIWRTDHSYRLSRFGLDWLTWLMARYGHGHWCLTVDADELMIYAHCEDRPLPALTEWLDHCGQVSFPALMLDMFPKGPLGSHSHDPEADPIRLLEWFDSGNYTLERQLPLENLWIQGGPRARRFFASDPRRAPTLNKVPLIKWNRRFVYVNSTHAALPRHLNRVYGTDGSELPSGVLLHTKFLPIVVEKSAQEKDRQEHFSNSSLYNDYYDALGEAPDLWHQGARRYSGWRQLEALGLMSRGGWL